MEPSSEAFVEVVVEGCPFAHQLVVADSVKLAAEHHADVLFDMVEEAWRIAGEALGIDDGPDGWEGALPDAIRNGDPEAVRGALQNIIGHLVAQSQSALKESRRCREAIASLAESEHPGRGTLTSFTIGGEPHEPRVTLRFAPPGQKKAKLKLVSDSGGTPQ